ncbi:helix-turn-helix transcriptional regulator [Rhodobacter sp. NTK016B]|uniref:helix-turn-helix transcriptional regulator n=1 Tax=Rhodobacter sp. NTK016B TaxID=2759676 RepID=UPI001A8E429E|nr:AraC family transcriptional regulator [Rhodobacter sp. NTK016B]MBN8290632.1 helix-turn-helix transcriptional regulator [Rhodobacter sp. NTK016B]
MPGQPDTQPAAKSLWRREFGDGTGTLRGVFRALDARPDAYPPLVDPVQGLFSARVDLPAEAGSGFYRFLSIRDEIFCGITNCTILDERHEEVRDEGMVELHFQIEGPVRLSWDVEEGSVPPVDDRGHPVHEATMVALRCAPDMTYTVRVPPGSYRLLGIYVTPRMLRDSMGLDSELVERFFHPPPGEIPLVERKISSAFVRALQGLWDIPFDGPRDLMRASAKLTEIICLVADALSDGSDEGAQNFSHRDFAMFERAREMLATDFSKNYSATNLARELGTNATKLKAGFKFFYGTTIFEYRKKYRMDYALTLLEEGELSIAEISQTAGYKRQASFTSAFKLHFGVLPSSARQSANPGAAPGQNRGRDDEA